MSLELLYSAKRVKVEDKKAGSRDLIFCLLDHLRRMMNGMRETVKRLKITARAKEIWWERLSNLGSAKLLIVEN